MQVHTWAQTSGQEEAQIPEACSLSTGKEPGQYRPPQWFFFPIQAPESLTVPRLRHWELVGIGTDICAQIEQVTYHPSSSSSFSQILAMKVWVGL